MFAKNLQRKIRKIKVGVGIKGRRPRGGTAYVSQIDRRNKFGKVSSLRELNINKQKKSLAFARGERRIRREEMEWL